MELVCPHCNTINRLPEQRLRERPDCGRCNRALIPAAPVALDATTFDRFVERSGLPVLVDFWAAWCGPCRVMAPQFEAAAAQLSGQIILAKLNTEIAPDESSRFRIRSIPTMILFRDGAEVARISGALPASEIVRWSRQSLAA